MRFSHCRLKRIFNIGKTQYCRTDYNGSIHAANREGFSYSDNILADLVGQMGFSCNVGDVVDGNWCDISFCQTILNNFEDAVGILKKGRTLQQDIEKNISINEDFQEYFANKYSLRLLR